MAFHSTRACVDALARAGELVRIEQEIDPRLEAAEIQRRVYAANGPAVYFARVKGSRFPMVSNLFGTMKRAELLFHDSLDRVRCLFELKADPSTLLRRPLRYASVPLTALHLLPRKVRSGPVLANSCALSDLPQMVSWPDDGGPFVTLPQVYSEDPDAPSFMRSNLGMYRVQLAGNSYEPDREIGLHYQIHRGIGVHHQAAIRRGEPLRVSVFVGGPPAMTVAAVMPLPEGLPELAGAGALSLRRVRLARVDGHVVHTDADFCIVGTIDPSAPLKPEGPFGDHLGYYSLQHDFPVLRVERVYHRSDAVWPFTVVGRPPQEDTVFGELIKELTGPVIPTVLPGVRAVHAVDASGVHPLLLAVGSERYMPFRERVEPQELLTQANAILGQGQMSLAKVLMIAADDEPRPDLHDIGRFFAHVLERADFRRDLHFQTRTTIDTLDYSGHGFNQGSKLVIAAAGKPIRKLASEVPTALALPAGFGDPRVCMPGILALQASPYRDGSLRAFAAALDPHHPINAFAWILLVDDAEFTARTLHNFLWVTFTRMNPAVDIDGIGAFTEHKHWGALGSLVIDARKKPHHAPPLLEDPAVSRRVDALAAPGGPLHGIL